MMRIKTNISYVVKLVVFVLLVFIMNIFFYLPSYSYSSNQESLNKTYMVPEVWISIIFNRALAIHGDALKALRDTYILSTNPELAAKFLEMSLSDPEKAKRLVDDYLYNNKR